MQNTQGVELQKKITKGGHSVYLAKRFSNGGTHYTSGLLYGRGCKKHPDCFLCPERDCSWNKV